MHELSIALEIHRIARGVAGAGALRSVKVAVGELSAIEPELLVYAWESVVADGPDAGSALVVDFRPSRQVCRACGEIPERAPGTWLRLCPRCSEPLRVTGGDELDVITVAFTEEEPEEEPCPTST